MALSTLSRESLAELLTRLTMTEEASKYLDGRGITEAGRSTFRLGGVPPDAPIEWRRFAGMLAIPYDTVSGPVAVKFRRLDGGSPKYDGPAGQKSHLFNVKATLDPGPQIVITEGEFDAITLHGECGIPAVAVPGASAWKHHYPRCVNTFPDVVILTDNDAKSDGSNPGFELAMKIKETVRDSRVVSLPAGEDVNSFFTRYGKEALIELIPDTPQ